MVVLLQAAVLHLLWEPSNYIWVGQAADYEGGYIDGELVCQDVKLGEMWGAHTALLSGLIRSV